MSDLRALSIACTEALRDADASGAKVAAHFLRVQIHELFRECSHQPHHHKPAETDALTKKSREHG